ncbi:MAG: hypothetical protein H6581_26345 [Bacteroidia bacterium]|nr:hypothetical protein [Bacteroidia bacterium]
MNPILQKMQWPCILTLFLLLTASQIQAQGFRVMFNGLHCLGTTDDGDDEVYLKYRVDGGGWHQTGNHKMDEINTHWYEGLWSAITKDDLEKAYWLAPLQLRANSEIVIEVWEDDPSPNPDDKIGTWVINSATPSGYHERYFHDGGEKYEVSLTVQKIAGAPAASQSSSFLNSDKRLMTDAVGNQGKEGACVAWSVTAAIGTKMLTQLLKKDIRGGSMGTNPIFDAHWFYQQRANKAVEGWDIGSAMQTAKTVTIPFKNNPNYGIRIRSYESITDKNTMRAALAANEPLVTRFETYEDFIVYAGKTGVYGGKITRGVAKGGHAVMVTGFFNPSAGDNNYPYWEIQNSWGRQWGRGGYCQIAEGACGVDDRMYRIKEIYVCDLNGKEVPGNEGLKMMAAAAGVQYTGTDNCADFRSFEFDPVFYADKYPDLKAAFGYDCGRLKRHWEESGLNEGRQSSPTFSVADYLHRYPDLVNAFGGGNYKAAWNHWFSSGKGEGRSPAPKCANTTREFDPEFYANKYPDLMAAFGYDCGRLQRHWDESGINEGRQSSPNFSISAYLNRYPDLVNAFGAGNYRAAWNHWFSSGKGEGRNPAP